ncbi:OPT/YSL family transporter [Burkholderia sp. BCC1988]|uniref:OPT/YSL family transporter n=1 Tax=Burkholderia sp. BCC1988 TaxID=2817443 RepID=UPI002AB19555|nr:OPT/YSL family transporter [Burkholderia sp. BCC1988]
MSSVGKSMPDDELSQEVHPGTFTFSNAILLVVLSIVGAIIGIEVVTSLGVTPITSIVGALVAMVLGRVPLRLFAGYRSIHVQNLAQSAISAATFGAANSLLLPIAIPYVFGRSDLVMPMFAGAALAMLLDGYLLYRMFDTRLFPASGAWPPGIAAAEAIKAGDQGGRQARLLGAGVAVGAIGSWFNIPMSAFGTAFIGNTWSLLMFGIGLLLRGYSQPILGIDIAKAYIPHGIMIGAGVVALTQAVMIIRGRRDADAEHSDSARGVRVLGQSLRFGAIAYVSIAATLAALGGLFTEMSPGMLIAFVLYAALAAFVHELIVGIAAMHSGWFPAFAVALITLLVGMLIGFPPIALALLCGFSAATGPAFADMGYDLKAGYLLRGRGQNANFEIAGRQQQFFAATLAFVISILVVYFAHRSYFHAGLIPPVAKVYVATIKAGVAADVAKSLAIWAIPGAIAQWLGGPKRQIGVLLATGLLIASPLAGWCVLTGIALRLVIERMGGEAARGGMETFAAGVIAGDALFSFVSPLVTLGKTGK